MKEDQKKQLQELKKTIVENKIAYKQIALITGLHYKYITERLKDKQENSYITDENLQLLKLKVGLLATCIQQIKGD